MMGAQAAPKLLFYDFCLEDHIPSNHLLRQVDRFLDLGDIRTKLAPFHRTIGRFSWKTDYFSSSNPIDRSNRQ